MGNKYNVLIVEDSFDRIGHFAKWLSHPDIRITFVSNTQDAYAALSKAARLPAGFGYDTVFLDHDLGTGGDMLTVMSKMWSNCENLDWNCKVWIHSCNPIGSRNLSDKLSDVNSLTVCDFGNMLSKLRRDPNFLIEYVTQN